MRERLALQHPRLHALLPPAFAVVENLDPRDPAGIVEAPSGHKLPSFIALERGTPLAQWRTQGAPPLGTGGAMQMLRGVTALLATLHDAGRAHRDVQPETVLWLAQRQTWRLSDFGACASLGALLPSSWHCNHAHAVADAGTVCVCPAVSLYVSYSASVFVAK